MWTDIMDRPLAKGDYVVYYSSIYQITELTSTTGMARILLIDKNKTTRSVKKDCHEMCKIDTEDVLIWKIKRGY